MFGRRFKLFKLFGFEVRIDASWFILAVLITWSLAQGLFPYYFKGLSPGVYWAMGAFGAVGLFLSIVAHEFSHALVARRFGIPMKGITLFIFGGVAEMEDEPGSSKAEFLMAIVGPLTSIALGVIMLVVAYFIPVSPTMAVFAYLGAINLLLAGFNLLPAFPLDGGRVLRSALWRWKKNLGWATRVSAWVGSAFGILLMVLGVVSFLRGNFIGGVWWFLIGMFLRSAAHGSYQQLLMRRVLEGETVRRFMRPNPVTVSRSTSLLSLVEQFIYRYGYKMYPVMEDDRLVGCITDQQVKSVPRDEWERHSVGSLAVPCSAENTITPDADVMHALDRMRRTGSSRLLVVEDGRLVGIIALKDLLDFLSLKMELEGGRRRGRRDDSVPSDFAGGRRLP